MEHHEAINIGDWFVVTPTDGDGALALARDERIAEAIARTLPQALLDAGVDEAELSIDLEVRPVSGIQRPGEN